LENELTTKVTNWLVWLKLKGSSAPYWLWLAVTVGLLLIRCTFDAIFLATWGFPEGTVPLWLSDVWWSELVNAGLIGFVPAALVIAHRGIERDLNQLQPFFLNSNASAGDIFATATRPAGYLGKTFKLGGIILGILYVFIDPSLTMGAEQSLSNPAFLWPLLRTPLFVWLIFTLIVADLNATRTYLHMGRNLIRVDLLDVQSLSPFARRGLRSSFTWIVCSIIFSLFWVGDTASRQNLSLFVTLLLMATGAFVFPLIGVRDKILLVKHQELERLRGEIRVERETLNSGKSTDSPPGPRLANLIAYYQLIEQAREWPIDGANLLRFFMYLLIGLGSWLGSAIVERLLDNSLN
jgi:hypothetical protein